MTKPRPDLARRPIRTALVDTTYDALQERIMDQVLAPGARINIDALALELGVSPTPVREALARLAAERLVQFTPFKGYSVVPLLTPRRLANLMHVRRILEVEAARLAAPRIILAQIRTMEQALEALTTLQPQPRFTSFREYNQQDQRFHGVIFQAADNDVLLETYQSLRVHLQLARLYHGRGEVDYPESSIEHRQIFEALCARDPDAAARAVAAHIEGVERRLGAVLDAQLAAMAARKPRTDSAGNAQLDHEP